jgi:hypothetical protein
MRFFVAEAPQNDGGFFGAVKIFGALRARKSCSAGGFGKAAAEPPHSILGCYGKVVRGSAVATSGISMWIWVPSPSRLRMSILNWSP